MKKAIKKYRGYIFFGAILAVALVLAFVFAPKSSEDPGAASYPAASVVTSAVQSEEPSGDLSAAEEISEDSRDSLSSEESVPAVSAAASSEASELSSRLPVQDSSAAPESSIAQEHSPEPAQRPQVQASAGSAPQTENSSAAVSSAAESSEKASAVSRETAQSSAEVSESHSSAPENDSVCTMYISCINAVKNDSLDRRKREYLPSDGIILPATQVGFHSGDSVFDILSRVCRERGIVLSAPLTPMYGTAYIEGISDLHERDCGPVSGWMYSVNGTFPSVGCSLYKPVDGDLIEIVYSCDLGGDVGNIYMGG